MVQQEIAEAPLLRVVGVALQAGSEVLVGRGCRTEFPQGLHPVVEQRRTPRDCPLGDSGAGVRSAPCRCRALDGYPQIVAERGRHGDRDDQGTLDENEDEGCKRNQECSS